MTEKRNYNVKDEVLNVIRTVAPDADLSQLKGTERLKESLELDSMDFLDIVMELRKRYKIEVPKEDYRSLETLDSAVKYLSPRFESL